MKEFQKYIAKRKAKNQKFAENYESRYQAFKIGVMLKMAREEAGLTQEQLAQKVKTKKSAISRIDGFVKSLNPG